MASSTQLVRAISTSDIYLQAASFRQQEIEQGENFTASSYKVTEEMS
jgi:hypothetical protein